MKKHRKLLRLFILLSFILVLVYHEKIITFFDSMTMPSNEEICKQTPINIGNLLLNVHEQNFNRSNKSFKERRLKSNDLSKLNVTSRNESSFKHRVAIIVPYRNRERNLKIFLKYMHQFLSEQNIFYGIYLVEPIGDLLFNRAQLLNIGFVESLKNNPKWNCFIFHDIDLLPENDSNLYQCNAQVPKQMAISISNYNYTY